MSDIIADYVEGEFRCVILSTPVGVLCGYLGLPKAHPWHGQDYGDIDAEVHGGLTYSDQELWLIDNSFGLWWIGFDCAHFWDLIPGLPVTHGMGTYKDEAYVCGELSDLVSQAAAAYQREQGVG